MATIKLKFRPSSVPETEGTLYYQVIHKRKVKWISTGYHVYPCEWDEKTGEVLIPPNSERKAELEKMQSNKLGVEAMGQHYRGNGKPA